MASTSKSIYATTPESEAKDTASARGTGESWQQRKHPDGFPSPQQKSKGKSPSRVRLSLLVFFGKTTKAGRPRQGTRPGMHHQGQNQNQLSASPYTASC
ncbi:hypothetical protein [Ralstonia syzygii]|uniref:hypothetical protein n=1 Tax=Ralstonia syzygii TaxID=28097 RepID=UPI0018D1F4EF|nr:hypothetical protein [Ralstonia syzygii]